MNYEGSYTDLMLDATNVESTPVQCTQSKTQKRSTNYTQDEENVVVASTTHLLRWKEERISFPSLLAQSEKLSQIPVNESKGEEEG
jgi:hypothetical protein